MYIVIQTKLFRTGSRWVEFSADWCKWHNYQTMRIAHEVRSLKVPIVGLDLGPLYWQSTDHVRVITKGMLHDKRVIQKPPQAYHLVESKWNESGFRPLLCTYRLNWARRTSWGWWDDWDDTVLQTQDSKFEPWRSEAEHATSRSRRLPTILTFTRGWGRNIFVSLKPPRPGTEPRTLAQKAAVLTTTLGPPPLVESALGTMSNDISLWVTSTHGSIL